MDVRKKLVELLQDENNPVWGWFPNNMAMMQLADYLISNGVAVQERSYQSITEEKPSKPGTAVPERRTSVRLIDADRALEIVRDQGIAHPNAYHLTNYATLILREAPTIDVAPVRHGRWVSIPHKLARVCSVCNRDEPYLSLIHI